MIQNIENKFKEVCKLYKEDMTKGLDVILTKF